MDILTSFNRYGYSLVVSLMIPELALTPLLLLLTSVAIPMFMLTGFGSRLTVGIACEEESSRWKLVEWVKENMPNTLVECLSVEDPLTGVDMVIIRNPDIAYRIHTVPCIIVRV